MAVRHECKVGGPPSSSSSVMVAISPRLVLQGGCRPLSGPLLSLPRLRGALFFVSRADNRGCPAGPIVLRFRIGLGLFGGSFYPSKWALFCLVRCLCVSVCRFHCFGGASDCIVASVWSVTPVWADRESRAHVIRTISVVRRPMTAGLFV